ncbi:beta-glucanase (GH16 family) [Stackebrandtia endophytica]|uniref:Beta-glucanase (GH16 family) n=1 Tax=Stackebrandtia endophytica TaxID=1496996 RepID=A0A543B139_9ACTN|nr:glycoside hydrolase family 16 protein [Stackebrandtia endophytica]TQL78544.1 beta-glucanase (GH16 family) [Stackebrandtia endophytica]
MMPIRRTVAAIAAAVLVSTLTLIQPATADDDEVAPTVGPLVFADEFDLPAGSPPDPTKWRHDIGGNGWGNAEHQYYTDSTDNIAHDGNGNLVITARQGNPGNYDCWYGKCEYTSGKITTAQTFNHAYGTYEARIKLPRGQGIWPAWWMLGDNFGDVGWPNSGEIDIMENIGREPGTVHGTVHGPGYSGGGGIGNGYTLPNGQEFADDFHVFKLEWAPGSLTWYVDGNQFFHLTPGGVGGNQWVFDHPFFMILNLAVGGEWPGYPDGSTQFPQTMVIDYIRVNALDGDGGGNAGQIVGVGGRCVDVAWGDSADGTQVQLANCSGNVAQNWNFASDGTVRALGKCLDVSGGSTADGARVQLWTCNGSGAQQWVHTGAGDLVNPQADKCLEATDPSGADGTPLRLWTCTGHANQKWTRA